MIGFFSHLPDASHWAVFALFSLALAATPGPGVVYIVARTLSQGRHAGLASVGGVALGNFGNALGASLGLAALLSISALAFNIVKFAGAGYLLYLGFKALRAGPAAGAGEPAIVATPLARIARDGFMVALLNPKTALFFAAFLPQFIDPQAAPVPQSVLLGAAFVAIAACTDSCYVMGASIAAPALRGLQRASATGRYVTAAVYIGLGLFTAASGTRGTR